MNIDSRSLAARLLKASLVLALAAGLSSCGDDAPGSPSDIPNISGNYSGFLTWNVGPINVQTIGVTMVVVQAGSQATINGALTLGARTEPFSAFTGNVNATGFFTATGGGAGTKNTFSPTCGAVTFSDASLTFSGNTARYVEHDNTQSCGTWTFSGTLTR